ncbi:hypothetical protein OJF2_12910 [Aquisphaera giovannonii]|uniref:DUF3108 domain-containing protein n=1 Tax=Aquisphaera giovannonii TaxID=406548 RepID=A0A5B9VXV4_9BACT|nr:hypothetical protein [Aquisphaera giovannonii]QEH32807.1 hypothetical protein OJF2_12910 [Aquisphaera giovannonii]
MPSRFLSLLLLVYWCIAAFCLLTWEILPELSLGYAPDLRAIAAAGGDDRPVTWKIGAVDDPKAPGQSRPVGKAVTSSRRLQDGWFELESRVELDAGNILRATPFGGRASVRVRIESVYRVDPSGNLKSFDIKVYPRDLKEDLFTLAGRLKGTDMEVVGKGPLPILNDTFHFHYEPRSVVQDALGPLDRLPGLHVGQRWDSLSLNPFTGQTEKLRVEVLRRTLIHWGGGPVSAFEVEQRANAMTARTWVRTDGLILRQEVPFPLVHLVLERVPEAAAEGQSQEGAR